MTQNRLIFLGSGGDSKIIGKGLRSSAGIVLQLDGSQFYINPGPACVRESIKNGISPRETIGVIITNNLLQNSNDINALADAMTLGGEDSFGVLICTDSVLNGSVDDYHDVPLLRHSTKTYFERIISINKYNSIGINNVEISPLKAKSIDPSGIGIALSIPGLKTCFTSNTSYFEGMASEYEGCNVLVINCKHPISMSEKGEMNVENVTKLLDKMEVKPSLIILTGFGSKLIEDDPLTLARNIRQQTSLHVIAAKDGLVIELDQYKSFIKQTKLQTFS